MKIAAVLAGLLVTTLGLAGCATDADDETGAAPQKKSSAAVHEDEAVVDMIDVAYSPQELRIHAGTKVTFRNLDDMGHTVTPDDPDRWGTTGSGDAPDQWMNKGDTWSWTFTEPGIYRYHCLPHATRSGDGYMGMVGTVIVE